MFQEILVAVNVIEILERKKMYIMQSDSLRDFAYLGDRVSTGGGCEAAMTARTRCG